MGVSSWLIVSQTETSLRPWQFGGAILAGLWGADDEQYWMRVLSRQIANFCCHRASGGSDCDIFIASCNAAKTGESAIRVTT